MGAEADVVCGAEYGQVSPGRVNRRNGYRSRRWDTRVGSIERGKRADIVVIDERVGLFAAIVAGRLLFTEEAGVPADVEVVAGA